MSDVTHILAAIDAGDPQAAAQLLPRVYDELRRLAAAQMAREKPGHTLDATALVHEAFLRLVGPNVGQDSNPVGSQAGLESRLTFANRRRFFAAAAEAMRRILVDHARRKQARKRGGPTGALRLALEGIAAPADEIDAWIDLDLALVKFDKIDAAAAELAKLRIFGGLSVEEAAETLNLSRATAFRTWTYARAWLTAALADQTENS